MSPALRSWIVFFHRWTGFPVGVGLFVLFASGALVTFNLELQQWMQPQTALLAPETTNGLTHAEKLLLPEGKKHETTSSFLRLPFNRDPVFRLWQYDGYFFHGPALHPETGQPLPTRDVVGSSFFNTLHAYFFLPNLWGRSLVSLLGVTLLIPLITGVMLHWRRFLSDLMLFRPHASSHRSWLDLHLLIGTLTLPLVFIIGLSGGILQIQNILNSLPPSPVHLSFPPTNTAPLSSKSLSALEAQGKHVWGDTAGGFFMPIGNDIYLYRPDQATFCITRAHISTTHPVPPTLPYCPDFHSLLTGIHLMRWAGPTMRWLYFGLGIVGAFLMASGLILFYKTECRQVKGRSPNNSLGLRVIYAFNTATIIGFSIATLGLLWSTRLPALPVLPPRSWETALFFALWAGSLVHALCFRNAARCQLLLLCIMGMGLLPIDLLTRPLVTDRPLLFLSVDGCGGTVGLLSLFAYRRSRLS
ncbi:MULTISPECIES: PepSY domain-containing protein [unclassified Saccharibacter]|uniref:PepSY-associated TM helix domain-containing protein n=1 Tax=unclassified Saccharibacter TaxID=2648722 RepID=UPI001323B3CD|nr:MULTISPECIES: PepSY-associated TM helix domain-containing protein [unclassified Saccharibacter]MXV36191.1 hypothetical protein [Saccharibacter sp. EH611]MXV57051.1 hypothetical protein [Saccharibacter sp. EH70]MXV66589.1 hypothetical protein [Saccharibacter sp. EH60]